MSLAGETKATSPFAEGQSRTTLIRKAVHVLAIATLLLWPAVVNGGPFFMSDTHSYLRASASGLHRFLGIHTEWSQEFVRVYQPQIQAALESGGLGNPAADPPVTLSGRSIYYGAFLSLCDLIGSLWLVAAVQSLLAASAIFITVDNIIPRAASTRRLGPLAIGATAAAATSLGFFVSYLMPDIFGGLGLLAVGNLLFFRMSQGRIRSGFWIAILLFSLIAHSANIPVLLGMTVVAILWLHFERIWLPIRELGAVVVCLGAAFLAQAIFAHVVLTTTGASPVRPPFVAMRLIADGPGYDYLKDHCGSERLLYCRALKLHRAQADILLWSEDPQQSLFRGLSPAEQRRSVAEQPEFVKEVFLSQPLRVLWISFANTVRQMASFKLDGFNYSLAMVQGLSDTVPKRVMENVRVTRAFNGTMPTRFWEVASVVTASLGALLLLLAVFAPRVLDIPVHVRGFCVAILAGVAINAAVCGALSGPKGRYQMRLIWILPVVAAAVVGAGRRSFALTPEQNY